MRNLVVGAERSGLMTEMRERVDESEVVNIGGSLRRRSRDSGGLVASPERSGMEETSEVSRYIVRWVFFATGELISLKILPRSLLPPDMSYHRVFTLRSGCAAEAPSLISSPPAFGRRTKCFSPFLERRMLRPSIQFAIADMIPIRASVIKLV